MNKKHQSAFSHFKTARERSREAFEIFKSKKILLEDFPQIISCVKVLAMSYYFFYSFDEETKRFTPLSLMNEYTLSCISRAFQSVLDDLYQMKER